MSTDYQRVASRMGPTSFIQAPADRTLYVRMCADVLAMDSEAPIVPVEAMGAWQRTFALYQSLLRRKATQEYGAASTLSGPSNADIEAEWARFEGDRQELIRLAANGRLSADVADVIGLMPGDLSDPIVRDERFGAIRAKDWQTRASRCGAALHRIQNLSSQERELAPWFRVIRQIAAATEKLEARVTELERGAIPHDAAA